VAGRIAAATVLSILTIESLIWLALCLWTLL